MPPIDTLSRSSRNLNRRRRLWICESEATKRCPQAAKQRRKPSWGDPRQHVEAASKEKHHEDKE